MVSSTCLQVALLLGWFLLAGVGSSTAAPGDLDNTFGSGGKVNIHVGPSIADEWAHSVAVQTDGKILLGGYVNTGYGLVRYNSNGTLDSSFGEGGKVVNKVGYDSPSALAIQRDGKILLAGSTSQNAQPFDFSVVRYNTNGTFDLTFGGTGKVITPVGSESDFAHDMVIQNDNKIVLGGYLLAGDNQNFALVRYNPNGSLDSSFGVNGRVITDLGDRIDRCVRLVSQSDGKLVAAGYSGASWALVRYHLNGTLDTTFDGDGKLVMPPGSSISPPGAVAVQGDGKILLAGMIDNRFTLFRFNPNGSLDSGFGVGGKVSTPAGTSWSGCTSLAVQLDGKIVAGGNARNGSMGVFALVRYHYNGAVDPTFAANGIVLTSVGSTGSEVQDVALQPDGKILATGRVWNGTYSDFGLVRYVGDSRPLITSQPLSQTVEAGKTAFLAVTASGTPPLYYQWRFYGTNIGGANAATLALTNVQSVDAGIYSVLVSNYLGFVTSSNATILVNHPPIAQSQTVTVAEDTTPNIALAGFDADGDWLRFEVVSQPRHGGLTLFQVVPLPGTTNSYGLAIYRPAPDYFGPDEFTFKVSDGLLESAPATVSITVTPVNDPPTAVSQFVATDEDTALNVLLTGADPDDDKIYFEIVHQPSHGSLINSGPKCVYTPNQDYSGEDLFTFVVRDQNNAVSGLAVVSITVHPVNDAPVARIVVSPLDELPGVTNIVALAPACCDATLRLDASESTDAENDALTYTWIEGTNILSTAITSTNRFKPGTHEFVLLVSDGTSVTATTLTVEIITPAEAVGFLKTLVEESITDHRDRGPLANWLREAGKAFERCQVEQGIHFLELFQKRVQERIAPKDAELAAALSETATAIREAAPDCDSSRRLGRPWDNRKYEDRGRPDRDQARSNAAASDDRNGVGASDSAPAASGPLEKSSPRPR